MHYIRLVVLLTILLMTGGRAFGAPIGQIMLQDGSKLHGEIIELADGILKAKAAFSSGDPIPIKWPEVMGLSTQDSITLVLANGVVLQGRATFEEPGMIHMQTDLISVTIPVAVDSVVAINPNPKKPITINGNLNMGGNFTSGNTELTQFNLLGEMVVRSKRFRLSLLGRWNYSEDSGSLISRNAFATIKLDFFLTKRFFVYLSTLFEQDTFQDLNLRTSITAGPGYQFIDKGDFDSPYLKKMELYAEAGLGLFNRDLKVGEDEQFATGRWALKFNWPVLPSTEIFHEHQSFPSLEDPLDFYLTSQQGIRIKLVGNFITALQMNWRYDNTPAPDKKPSDFQWLLTLGYQFES